jgi:hypothetical protein
MIKAIHQCLSIKQYLVMSSLDGVEDSCGDDDDDDVDDDVE